MLMDIEQTGMEKAPSWWSPAWGGIEKKRPRVAEDEQLGATT